jgi:hypothetical protein
MQQHLRDEHVTSSDDASDVSDDIDQVIATTETNNIEWQRGDYFVDTNGNTGRFIDWCDDEQSEANVMLANSNRWKLARIKSSVLREKLS